MLDLHLEQAQVWVGASKIAVLSHVAVADIAVDDVVDSAAVGSNVLDRRHLGGCHQSFVEGGIGILGDGQDWAAVEIDVHEIVHCDLSWSHTN